MPLSPLFTDAERTEFGACFRLLATVLRFSPEAPDVAPFLGIVRDRLLGVAWPCGEEAQLDAINTLMVTDLDMAGLREAYQRLFIGPNAFEAPAWGSVYLDKESVLFGDSTLELRSFLSGRGAALDSGMNEPEDHIGLLLWLVSDFLVAADDAAATEVLEHHILPWSGRYLELLAAHAGHPFYEGLSHLITLTLAEMVRISGAKPVSKTLYR